MRKRNTKKSHIKKIFIILTILFSFFWVKYYVKAVDDKKNEENKILMEKKIIEKKNIKIKIIDKKLKEVFLELENKKTKLEQKNIYKKFINIIDLKIINNKNNFFLEYIKDKIIEKDNSIKIDKKNYSKHNTKILKFTRDSNHNSILNNLIKENNKNKIESVFIFRKYSDLSRKDINIITKKLTEYNKEILIFIDQEWGLINRYVEFEKTNDVEDFFLKNKYSFLEKRFEIFNKNEVQIIRNLFPKKYWYFPSLWKIWKNYDLFDNENKKVSFLEIIAFIRLQTLKNNWINTYWLVADLNRWNTVISGNSRSFSKHLWKYKILANSFLKASRNTWVKLYLKHFPGHWEGKIDSHKWILNLSWKEEYLKENLELFDYFFQKWEFSQIWIMVWHMYVPKTLENIFNKIIEKSSFLLTDDLAMSWYQKAKNKIKKDLFFTTDNIINSKKLIIVDTVNIAKIK